MSALCCVAPASGQDAPGLVTPRYDHLNPVLLNEMAVAKMRDGDVTTAWILLERAARLAPHDERILRNLQEVKAYRAGKVLGPIGRNAVADPELQAVAAPTAAKVAGKPVAAQPPPLWPAGGAAGN